MLSCNVIIHSRSASALCRPFTTMQVLMSRLSAVRQRTSDTSALPPTFLSHTVHSGRLCTVVDCAVSLTGTSRLPVNPQIHLQLLQFWV